MWLGVSADVDPNGNAQPLTAFGGARVTETNLVGTGVALGGAFAVADQQLALRVKLADPQFLRTNWVAEAELLYSAARDFFGNRDVLVDDPTQPVEDFAVAQYKRFGGRVGTGHDVGVSSQVFFEYRFEKIDASLPRAASDNRGVDVEPIDFMLDNGSSILSTLRATFVNDTRDEPFLPSRGRRLQASLDASLTPLGSDYTYAKLQLDTSQWFLFPWGHVLQLRGFVGGVFGNAPLFERFYVGDLSDLLPDRVLDLSFDRRPAPNFLDTDIVEIRTETTRRSSTPSTAYRSTAGGDRSTASISSGASGFTASPTSRTSSSTRAGTPASAPGRSTSRSTPGSGSRRRPADSSSASRT